MAQTIVIKTEDRVFVAAGSSCVTTLENNAAPLNSALWVPKGCKHTILCQINSFNCLPLLRNIDDLIDENFYQNGVSKQYLMQRFVPRVVHELQSHNYIKKGVVENLECNLIIASENRSYLLGYSSNIRELPKLYGCPASNAFDMALYEELEPMQDFTMDEKILILFYYGWLSEHSIFLPITIQDTKTMEVRTYYMEDMLKVIHRFENKEED